MYLHANLYEFGICRFLGQLYFKMITVLSCEKQERAFLCLHYGESSRTEGKTQQKCDRGPLKLGLIGVYSSQTCPH